MSDGSDQQSYRAGERISVGVELQDDSGIYDVTALFVHSDNPNAVLTLPGYGGGSRQATVYIQNFVTTNTLPGQYVCKYIQAQDGRGNYRTFHPDISFSVDQQTTSVDGEGPELQGWGFPSEEIEVVEMSVIEAEKGDVQQYANRRAAEVASGTTEDTDEQEDAQVAPRDDGGHGGRGGYRLAHRAQHSRNDRRDGFWGGYRRAHREEDGRDSPRRNR